MADDTVAGAGESYIILDDRIEVTDYGVRKFGRVTVAHAGHDIVWVQLDGATTQRWFHRESLKRAT